MFRRTQKSEAAVEAPPAKEGGKGRPTPSRKEAEAAARERAKAGMDKKAAAKLLRERRIADNAKIREGMRTGDERYLFARDKGPVRRFIRDWVDARLTFLELMLPVLVIVMALQLAGSERLVSIGYTLWTAAWILLVIDVTWMFIRLNRELKRRFPKQDHKGWRFYALMRALQVRPMRQPKPQVKMFAKLPEHYR